MSFLGEIKNQSNKSFKITLIAIIITIVNGVDQIWRDLTWNQQQVGREACKELKRLTDDL